jgi:hypothetical protein
MDITEQLAVFPVPIADTIEPAAAPIGKYAAHFDWLFLWGRRVAEYGFVQCWVQLLTAVAGLIIVRTLAKQDYALYAIANSMQSTCHLLSDVGIGIGVRSIGGRVWNDRRRLGELINTALGMRQMFAAIAIPVCIPITVWMLWKNGCSPLVNALLCGVLLIGVLPLLSSSVFEVVPQLHGEYRRMQKLDFGNATLRLLLIGSLALMRMNAWLAASVGAVTNWIELIYNRRWTKDHADLASAANAQDRCEMRRLTIQAFPNILFFCLQGQVTLLILTLVGSPLGIANITALGRLATFLTVISVAVNNMLAPRFARCQSADRLPKLYLMMLIVLVLLLAPVVLAAWLFPGPLLLILGNRYSTLGAECGWVVLSSCVAQLTGLMWALNSSRAWIKISSTAWIPLTLIVQALLPFALDLSLFRNVLIFQFVTACIPLPLLAADAIIHLRRRS